MGRLVKFAAVIVAIGFLGPIADIRFVTLDDRWFAAWTWHDTWTQVVFQIAAEHGRFPKLTSFLQFVPYLTDNWIIQAALRLSTILVSVWMAGKLLERTSNRSGLALTFAILFFAFAQNSNEHNLFTAYPVAWEFSWLCWIVGVLGLINAIEDDSLPIACLGAIVWLAGLQEGFIPQTAVHCLIALVYWRAGKNSWKYLAPYLLGLVIWLLIWAWWRLAHPSLYQGSQLAFGQSISEVLLTTANYSFGGLPFATFFYGGAKLSIEALRQSLDPLSIVKAAAVFIGIAGIARYVRSRAFPFSWRKHCLLSLVLLFLAFAPNILIGLTPKYQEWMRLGSHAYLYSHFSYFAWIGLLCLWLFALFSEWRSTTVAIAIALTMAIGSILTDALNLEVNSKQEQMGRRWDSMLTFIHSSLFHSIPEDSGFWFRDSSVSGSEKDDAVYWQYVVKGRTNKDVLFTSDLGIARSSSGGGSYLYLYDEPRSENQYVLLAPFMGNVNLAPQTAQKLFATGFEERVAPWVVSSKRLWVFPNSANEQARINGTFVCEAAECLSSIEVNGNSVARLFGSTFSVLAPTVIDGSGAKVIELTTSRPFDVTSISVDFPRVPPTGNSPVSISMDNGSNKEVAPGAAPLNSQGCDSILWIENLVRDGLRLEVEIKLESKVRQNLRVTGEDATTLSLFEVREDHFERVIVPVTTKKGLTPLRLGCTSIASGKESEYSDDSMEIRSLGLRLRDGNVDP